jgi:hypothetical protein
VRPEWNGGYYGAEQLVRVRQFQDLRVRLEKGLQRSRSVIQARYVDRDSADGPRRWIVVIGLTALVGLAGCNNLLRALELVTSFG